MRKNLKSIQPFVLGLLLSVGQTMADDNASRKINAILEQSVAVDQSARQSQGKVDQLQTKTQGLQDEVLLLTKELELINLNNAHLEQVLQNLQQKTQQTDEDIDAVADVEAGMTPYLLSMIDWLSTQIQKDIPFHQKERQERIAYLKASMIDADLSVAERYRRILEAYQVESEFGYTQESYPHTVEMNGQKLRVTIYRLGRIGLYCQTHDRQLSGYWDQSKQAWQILPSSYNKDIQQAILAVNKQRPAQLLVLPVQGGDE